MGFLKTVGKLALGTAKVTGKVALGTAKVAGKGAVAVGNTVYSHREQIGKATAKVAKGAAVTVGIAGYGAYQSGKWITEKVVQHRREIGGVAVGTAKGAAGTVADAAAYVYARESAVQPIIERIRAQSTEYQQQLHRVYGRIDAAPLRVRKRDVVLDSLVVGGNTLASYANDSVKVPPDVERAYQLAYPDLASHHTFAEEVRSLSSSELEGFVSGVKGKLFELEYVEYLNDGHLPSGYHAVLAQSATQPGWDIAITGPDGHMKDVIQAKATDSVEYVKTALEKYPHIDVVTTEEVHSQLVMQGFGDNVIDSHIAESAIHGAVQGATDAAAVHFSWTPSVISLALIAFSAYSKDGLDAYEKSKSFGERSVRSYVAYLAGGAVAVASGLWWLGMIGGIGSRLILGRGNSKRERLDMLKDVVKTNEKVLARLRQQPAV